jgi:hypothetical protein
MNKANYWQDFTTYKLLLNLADVANISKFLNKSLKASQQSFLFNLVLLSFHVKI